MATQQRERLLAQMLRNDHILDLRDLEILDIGCGSGALFLRFMLWGATPRSLHGIDLRSERVKIARSMHPDLDVVEGSASSLPWEAGRFDMVAQFTAFTSMPDAEIREAAAREVDRVLKPGGIFIWYDFWINPSNPNTHPIRAREVKALFPAYAHDLRRVTLAPPIARALAPRAYMLASLLQEIPFLQSHLLGVFRKAGGRG